MDKKWLWIGIAVIVVIIVAGGGFYFLNSNQTATPEGSQTPTPTLSSETSETEDSAMTEGSEIVVEGNEFEFTPSEVTVKKGETVTLVFKNTGSVPHDFTIADLDIATARINPGEQDSVEFTPTETGEFKIICSVGNHEEQGMAGTLIVEE
ncbi:MAG: hypothetical protein A3A51_03165 [Candidatus Levybacteria bacterium RIFCSPLOWO2_01_FULL_39_10]|nr:MAG: hypothetical protein A3A51_03165 [Candidatus Levybacteria bacterium RIFCSPLOWO2_01_FULL_39_10]